MRCDDDWRLLRIDDWWLFFLVNKLGNVNRSYQKPCYPLFAIKIFADVHRAVFASARPNQHLRELKRERHQVKLKVKNPKTRNVHLKLILPNSCSFRNGLVGVFAIYQTSLNYLFLSYFSSFCLFSSIARWKLRSQSHPIHYSLFNWMFSK
jgi:hypothetical protein